LGDSCCGLKCVTSNHDNSDSGGGTVRNGIFDLRSCWIFDAGESNKGCSLFEVIVILEVLEGGIVGLGLSKNTTFFNLCESKDSQSFFGEVVDLFLKLVSQLIG
jgi:hypothetical protein